MQTDNLKHTLLDKLISVKDESIIQKVNDLLVNVDIDEPIFKLTDIQKQMLAQSEEDILNGNLISDDDLNAEEDQWLNA